MPSVKWECICRDTQPGESVHVVGGIGELGNWDTGKSVPMGTSADSFPKWSSPNVGVPSGHSFEYKFVIRGGGGDKWEGIDGNRQLRVEGDGTETVTCQWGKKQGVDAPPPMPGGHGSVRDRVAQAAAAEASRAPASVGGTGSGSVALDDFGKKLAERNGQGKSWRQKLDAVLDGLVETLGLVNDVDVRKAAGGDGGEMMEVRKRVRGAVEKALVDRPKEGEGDGDEGGETARSPLESALSSVGVFLKFVQSGAVPCSEDGGHHRPNHHARTAMALFEVAEALEAEASSRAAAAGWRDSSEAGALDRLSVALRALHRSLPSFDAEFTAAVPLTRIRDIAHRNDIPQDLKQEIKHRLQNKLHRCAGPEDLRTAEELMQRFDREPHRYAGAFLHEYRVFFQELLRFFNQTDLAERLHKIKNHGATPKQVHAATDNYFRAKDREHHEGGRLDPALAAADAACTLRHELCRLLLDQSSQAYKDVALRQQLRLSELELADAAFLSLSVVHQKAEGANLLGVHTATIFEEAEEKGPVLYMLRETVRATAVGVAHVGLSGVARRSCAAVAALLHSIAEKELQKSAVSAETFMRLAAGLDQATRVAEGYCDAALALYGATARSLGPAVGANDHAVKFLAEADVRAHVAFQLSKLAPLASSHVRARMGSSGLECVVAGEGVGTLRVMPRLSEEAVDALAKAEEEREKGVTKGLILLVRSADGDEEMGGASRKGIRGVILGHAIPHLSHLAIRARQERLPFVSVVEQKAHSAMLQLVGKRVKLEARPDGGAGVGGSAIKAVGAGGDESPISLLSGPAKVPSTVGSPLPSSPMVGENGGWKDLGSEGGKPEVEEVDLGKMPVSALVGEEIEKQFCGAKAAACAALFKMGKASGGVFEAPACVGIPFGSLERVAKAKGAETAKKLQGLRASAEDAELSGAELEEACTKLRYLVASLRPSASETGAVKKMCEEETARVGRGVRLMVRSSANVEDLGGLSAAGLYDSVADVDGTSEESIGEAVAAVWASLFTKRAVLARRDAKKEFGVGASAHMGVLAQPMKEPNLCFVLHTRNPFPISALTAEGGSPSMSPGKAQGGGGKADGLSLAPLSISRQNSGTSLRRERSGAGTRSPDVYAEVAHGHGEILASGAVRGVPYRAVVDKDSGRSHLISFSSFSVGLKGSGEGGLVEEPLDYLKERFYTDSVYRKGVLERLGKVGAILEKAHKGVAQDVEGLIESGSDALVVVQTRPQPL
uniref:CBM20 domain-containing protein n=1 Tax=Chromera velia CCMP2878 TaxID=1169474 RepID=A0A0G4I0L9_9ALVE|eukprot:Cvel_9976.t1-p1 / transcript=Cvel_9976.t1 / gene=Cvel_9976 / organism=Chromera_velia_CCMP2878 / gene_product=Phosphoglucan, water dikinase, chloroplastic, putative / transcript_product=Phosphoglucan, water dikinase, chloroplastic, putative / location=Cvel_scaffold590:44630-52093(-) / protein_length=1238 / sequence_SO=supercontig / SO=protein_coding / is_pseudo=false